MIILREATDADAALLSEKMNLSRADAEEMIGAAKARSYHDRFFALFVISSGDTLVGTVSLYEQSPSVVSIGPEIFDEYRRHGYGAEALKQAVEIARSKGYLIVSQQIRTDNAASLRLHETLGFETNGTVYKNRKQNDVYLYLKAL